jgi:acyl carrier protein phosphodiesterase
MNYLAHAYLSFNDQEILVGNMVSDFVKGRAKFSFSGRIQHGIMLHRHIDAFTDTHEATRRAKEFFRPHYRLYSGPITDVLYDHFLANDPTIFDEASLKLFANDTYRTLRNHEQVLPPLFGQVLYYMRTHDWLSNYSRKEGIRRSLTGLINRAAFISDADTAYNLFIEHYVQLEECYSAFFPDVKQFAKQKFETLD